MHALYWLLVVVAIFGVGAILRSTPLPYDRTDGLLDSTFAKSLPQGYVIYPEGFRSINMPIGNARDYAKIFGGKVVAL
jgi:hypothetical protein